MPERRITGDTAIFLLIAVLALAAAFVAFSSTGEKGIEERFEKAVGLSEEEGSSGDKENSAVSHGTRGEDHGEEGGFSVEGSPVLYGLILAVLIVLCLIAYRTFQRT